MNKIRCNFRKFSTILAMTAVLAVVLPLKACAKEPEPTGIITMTAKASEVSFTVAGTGDITIDWGDGKKSNLNDATFHPSFDKTSGYFEFSQSISGTASHNIVINGNVTELYCQNIGLTTLDVSRNTTLTHLNCSGNQLTILDMSRNTALVELNCNRNQLTVLEVSNNTALAVLECNSNKLTSLAVNKNTKMGLLSLVGNQLTTPALNDLFRSLPDMSEIYVAFITIAYREIGTGNPGNFDCDRSIAEKKGWTFMSERGNY